MAIVYPDFMTISKLRTPPTDGEFFILEALSAKLDSSYEIFFNPFLDGDRPDIIILKKWHCAIIIEVKDWNLSLYSIDLNNKWSVHTTSGDIQRIRSPHQQVFRYKSNMFELHFPVLGMKEALNKVFFGVIHPFVYFHNVKLNDLQSIYAPALASLSVEEKMLNDKRRQGNIAFEKYKREMESLSAKKRRLERDRAMSFFKDSIDKWIAKINKILKNSLFSEEIYNEFKRRLSPPDWTYLQGIAIEFDDKQKKYIKSIDGFAKIKGVAGCGKTSIIAARAINAYIRHESVLILTFNITLKQLIRDKISHINYHSKTRVDFNRFEIANYHQFFLIQLNNLGIEIEAPNSICSKKGLEDFWDETFKKVSCFQGKEKETIRYRSIFIDEIQDYEKEWITIVRDYFLEPDGEMVLFGDQSQNIYQRDEDPLNKSLVKGFGRWEKLTKSYRHDKSWLASSFKGFQEKFLANRHDDLEIFEVKPLQRELGLDLLKYHFYGDNKFDEVNDLIDKYIKDKELIPNDIAILSSRISILQNINDFFEKSEKTITTFITNKEKKELDQNKLSDYKKVERRKKEFFVQNSGLIKLSTIHSFKGLEAETVFCILNGDEDPELVYTAITRAKQNLVIFDKQYSKFADFFQSYLM